MKIFELRWHDGEKEWIAARTNIEALKLHNSIADIDICEFDDDDEIVELPESEWSKHTIRDIDEPEKDRTFADFMKDCKSAELIAGTIYD